VSAFGINLINKYNKKLNLINKYNKKLHYNSTIRNIVNNVILLYCVYKGLSTKTALLIKINLD
jgi:hypothetical protein